MLKFLVLLCFCYFGFININFVEGRKIIKRLFDGNGILSEAVNDFNIYFEVKEPDTFNFNNVELRVFNNTGDIYLVAKQSIEV